MEAYDIYTRYVALKLHFTSDHYDFIASCGKTRASERSYNKRRDRAFFEMLSTRVKDKDIVPFFVAQFVQSNTLWVGDMVLNYEAAMKVYRKWIGRFQTVFKLFNDDVIELRLFLEERELEVDSLFYSKSEYDHPLIFKFYLEGMINLESMVILNREYNFVSRLDKTLIDPVWEYHSRLFKKYESFLRNINFKNMKIMVDKTA